MQSMGTAGPTTVPLLFTINTAGIEGLRGALVQPFMLQQNQDSNPSQQSKAQGSLQQSGTAHSTQQADQAAVGQDDA